MKPSRYERYLEATSGPASRLAKRFAEAAIAVRNSQPASDTHHAAVRDVAASVAAPMLVSYVLWVLLDAQARELKRLYFLSRDGQVLLDIARRLATRGGFDLDLRYLCASRQSWNRVLENPNVQDWLWGDLPPGATLSDFFRRLGVSEAEGYATIVAAGGVIPDGPLSARKIRAFRSLFHSPVFALHIAEVRSRQRTLVEAYLAQEGLFDTVPKAIVDIGWIGRLHETLSVLLAERRMPPAHGYFFGLKRFPTPWASYRHGFCFDGNVENPIDMLLPGIDLFVLAEVFCAADHGTVVGFQRDEDMVVPEFATGWPAKVMTWGFSTLRTAVTSVVEKLDLVVSRIFRTFDLG